MSLEWSVKSLICDLFYEDSTNDYFRAEEVLSNTILTFSSKQLRTLCFTTGHSERSILDTSKEGLSFLNEELSRYRLNSIVINPNISPIDSSCHVLVIASPETALTQRAIGHIEQYTKANGKVLLFLDDDSKSGLIRILNEKGLFIESKVYKNIYASYLNIPDTVVPQMNNHRITKLSIENQLGVVFYKPIGFTRRSKDFDYEYIPLLTDTIPNSKIQQSYSKPSVIDLGVLLEQVQGGSSEKWIVFSDSDFISNKLIMTQSNLNLTLDSMIYLAGQSSVIRFQSKQLKRPEFVLSKHNFKLVLMIALLLLPLLCFLRFIYLIYLGKRLKKRL